MDYTQTKEKTQWSQQNTTALGVQRGGSQAYLLMLQAWICEIYSFVVQLSANRVVVH